MRSPSAPALRRYVGIFTRWRRRGARPELVTVPVTVADQELQLVLGLQWHTVLGSDLHRRARRKARASGATHWVHAGGRAESVGVAWLSRRHVARGARRTPAHAGAQLFARGLPAGVYALAWALDDGRYWLALARDGQVLGNGDVILPSSGAVLDALQRARARFGDNLRCLGLAAELLPEAAADESLLRRVTDWQALAAAASAASLLQPVHASWHRIPGPVVVLLLVTLAGAVAQMGWQTHTAPSSAASAPGGRPSADAPTEIDAQAAWTRALAQQTSTIQAVTVGGLQQLWTALGQVPGVLSGWRLERMQCALAAADWRCSAVYQRASRLAYARDFAEGVPTHWQLNWDTLDSVRAEFVVPVASSTLRWAGAAAAPGLLPTADTLQPLRPLLRRVEVGRATPLPLAAPLDADGMPLARPAHLAVPVQRQIMLEGPWRSIVLAAPTLIDSIAWQRLEINVQPAVEPGLTTSTFMASLYGVSYEKR